MIVDAARIDNHGLSPLAFEAFDDTEYDLRTPEEWMDFCS